MAKLQAKGYSKSSAIAICKHQVMKSGKKDKV